ncbi:GRIPAP1 [Cervus elaphus hippelaphus]|uniref:GRIPAP1 n=1 Tax=Cervus elaphus hippelaphus TaxID=46360 RepID=A0A212C0G3_CEREH|nr:GRIPAP1 [Cervus elaphus hippelaphus]
MEQLERENQQLKAGAARAGAAQAGSLVDGELLRLQAENTALQKNVAALQERYGKEAGRSPAACEGEGDPPGVSTSPIMAPMPLAEVELKWEMEKEEKRLLWEQLQGLESLAELRDQRQGERLEHAAALRALQDQARTRELETLQQTVEELQAQVHSMDGAKGWFERRLKEAEESLQQQQQEQEEALRQCREQHASELKSKEEELQGVQEQLRQAQEERDCHLKTINSLKQEVKDTVDGQRILEKKGSAALKDLKRQLHLERKRADKLQERLQDILTNSKSRSGLEELVLSEMNSPSRTQTGDSSSVSSFSYREILREKESSTVPARSLSSSPQAQPPRPAELSDEEVAELFQRLAEMQQEKWMLEEKVPSACFLGSEVGWATLQVKHLEVSSASMAEDLCRKSAIIETYVMDSRIAWVLADVSVAAGHTDRSGLGSVLRDLVKPGDENLREMNKKLQNMLEEQLTKNMHLHKASDMEVLSQEIVRLSKECVGSPDPDLEPGEAS